MQGWRKFNFIYLTAIMQVFLSGLVVWVSRNCIPLKQASLRKWLKFIGENRINQNGHMGQACGKALDVVEIYFRVHYIHSKGWLLGSILMLYLAWIIAKLNY